jgi:hypothetical protein
MSKKLRENVEGNQHAFDPLSTGFVPTGERAGLRTGTLMKELKRNRNEEPGVYRCIS